MIREKIKRGFSILIIMILLSVSFCGICYADDEEEEESNESQIQEDLLQASAEATNEPKINSRRAIIYDRKSKTILYGKDENKKIAMASTTKIMTAIVVIEKGNLSDVVTVTKKAALTGGSRLGLKTNDKISVNDLLYGLMLKSRK